MAAAAGTTTAAKLAPAISAQPFGGGRILSRVFVAIVVTMVLVSAVWVVGHEQLADAAPGVSRALLIVGSCVLVAALAAPLAGATVRAIARHTFMACARTKVAAVFVVLLGLALITLPMIVRGDGTLAGRVQTFLAYGTGITSLLLSLVTVFLSAGVIANDVRTKQVFSVATKPVGRWQYVLGRWLGLVMLNALLLAAAAGVLYGLAQYLRTGRPLNPDDRRKLETEVLTARVKVPPVPVDIEGQVNERLAELKSDPRKYEDALAAFLEKTKGDKDEAAEKLENQIRGQILEKYQTAAPRMSLRWKFEGIDVAGKQVRGRGKVQRLAREYRTFRIETDEWLASHLIYRGPVRINDVEGRVVRAGIDSFDVRFSAEAMGQTRIAKLQADSEVEIIVDPVIQIEYKASAAGELPDDLLHGAWFVTNPTTGALYYEGRSDPIKMVTTLTPPARVVDDRGRTQVVYINQVNPQTGAGTKVTIRQQDIAVLFRVGRFEANFLRGIGLILLQLMFLAAMGVLAASFASFPVACLVCFVLLPLSMARAFLRDAVKLPTSSRTWEVAWYEWVGHYAFRLMAAVLPDFARASPGDRLVDGLYISWEDLGGTALFTVALPAVGALALACLIFHKRELARVQV